MGNKQNTSKKSRAKDIVKSTLSRPQLKFIKHLEEHKDLPSTMLDLDVKQDKVRLWMKRRVEFRNRFFEAINLSPKQFYFIEVLAANRCNLSRSAEIYGISRRTAQYWIERSDEFNIMYMELLEGQLDFGEECLIKNMEKEKEQSIFFFLRTKGKHRGYVEKTELAVTQKTEHTFKSYTDEELDKFIDDTSDEIQKS